MAYRHFASAIVILILFAGLAPAFADVGQDEAEIRELIERSYVHGAFNELSPEELEKGFHPDFAIFSPDGEAIKKFDSGWRIVAKVYHRHED